MERIGDTISCAIEERRDLRFWHDAMRLTLSPYLFGLTEDGDAIVAGVTSTGECVSLRMADIVGVEIVPRRRHPVTFWNADGFAKTLVAAQPPA